VTAYLLVTVPSAGAALAALLASDFFDPGEKSFARGLVSRIARACSLGRRRNG
jgi:hypothetical protein